MDSTIKALLAKTWKDENVNLEPGRHYFDETVTVRLVGTVEKQADQLVAPTSSVPLILTLALFWEKCRISRDEAIRLLREAITEAMVEGVDTNEEIQSRMEDVETAVKAVKDELIAKLPKTKRSGRVVTKDLQIEVLPTLEEALVPAA